MANLCWCYGPEGARLRIEQRRAINRGDKVIPYAPGPGDCFDCNPSKERVFAVARVRAPWWRRVLAWLKTVGLRPKPRIIGISHRLTQGESVTHETVDEDGIRVHVHYLGSPCDECDADEAHRGKPEPTTMPGPGERAEH